MSLYQRLIDQFWRVKPEIFRAEIVVTCILLGLAYLCRHKLGQPVTFLHGLADRRWAACGFLIIFVLAVRLALLPLLPPPVPLVRDEFSHLLGSETYAAGRVANPTHSKWVHFEAPYTIQRPSYVSAYPPGQALPMSAAQALGVSAWWGVWLTTGLLCGVMCWALQGWLPPRWAFFTAVVAALRYGILSYWMNSYWGGGVPALGGALAIGALPRLRNGGPAPAICLAAGLAITVIARPYEGLVLMAAIAAAVLWSSRARVSAVSRIPLRHLLVARVAVPALLLLFMVSGGMLYYCLRTTGRLELPYMIYIREYWAARHFIPMALPPKREYRHDVFNAMAIAFRGEHERARSIPGFVERNAERAIFWWMFYCGPLLTLPIIFGFRAFFDLKTAPLLVAAVVFALGLSFEVPKMPHYAAPFTAAWLVIWARAARHAAVFPYGRALVYLVAIGVAALLLVYRPAKLLATPATPPHAVNVWEMMNWCCVPRGIARADVERELNLAGGRHLVFFRTPARQLLTFDWVYNKPDIDKAQIVWARAMSAEEDASLCAYYPDRHAWLVDATLTPPTLQAHCADKKTQRSESKD